MSWITSRILTTTAGLGAWLMGCGPGKPAPDAAAQAHGDTTFAGVQSRGQVAMGVDQYTSQHVFEDLADGGRIVLERGDSVDSAGIVTIRNHMRDIAGRFAAGDFALPGFVHDREVPGTRVMAAKRDRISYQAVDRPKGGELRITSEDSVAVTAIHDFLAFQRMDHHAAGHEHQ